MLFFFFFQGKNKVIINHLFQFFTRKKKKEFSLKYMLVTEKQLLVLFSVMKTRRFFLKKSFENQLLRSVKQKQKETVATTKVNVVLFLALNFQENKEGA